MKALEIRIKQLQGEVADLRRLLNEQPNIIARMLLESTRKSHERLADIGEGSEEAGISYAKYLQQPHPNNGKRPHGNR